MAFAQRSAPRDLGQSFVLEKTSGRRRIVLKPRYPVVLASGSPRRKHLLAQIFAEFDIVIPNIDESIQAAEPEQAALDIAERKARTVFAQRLDSLVIAADTIVVFQKMILNKPDNEAHAVQMLTQLSGSCHTVITAVALLWPQGAHSFAERSEERRV